MKAPNGRKKTGVVPLDDVLGGGVVHGSVILLVGEAGIGKSTLLMQAVAGLRLRALYASGEESAAAVGARARALGVNDPNIFFVQECGVERVLRGATRATRVVAIDSLQTLCSEKREGRGGSPSQIKACVDQLVAFAKRSDTVVIMTGHVTLKGKVAGPSALTQMVDVVVKLERADASSDRRRLRCVHKNRFGSTDTVGHLTMTPAGLVP